MSVGIGAGGREGWCDGGMGAAGGGRDPAGACVGAAANGESKEQTRHVQRQATACVRAAPLRQRGGAKNDLFWSFFRLLATTKPRYTQ